MRWLVSLIFAGIALFGEAATDAGEMRELVLAAAQNSAIPSLTNRETRKLYLGVPVEKDGVTIVPLLNVTDDLLFQVFLQKVTFMSAETYEKQVASLVFRLGGQRPEAYRDRLALVTALKENQRAVTFLWSNELSLYPGLRPISTLWAGATD